VADTFTKRKPHSPGRPLYNQAHPLARGLVFGVIPGGHHKQDIVTGNFPSQQDTGSLYSGRHNSVGDGWDSNSTSDGGISWPVSDQLRTITKDLSMVVFLTIDSMVDWAAILTVPYDVSSWSSPYYCFGMNRKSNETNIRLAKTVGTTHDAPIGSAGLLTIPEPGVLMCAQTLRDTKIQQYKNGSPFGTTPDAQAGVIPFPSTATEVALMYRSAALSGEGTDGLMNAAFIWNRTLSPKEMAQIYSDPYAFIRAPAKVNYFVPGIADLTLDMNLGTFAITGNSQDLSHGKLAVATLGTFTLSGLSQDLSAGKQATIDLGTFVISGLSQTLLQDRLSTIDLGTYLLNGLDVDLTVQTDNDLLVDTGIYNITGNSQDLVYARILPFGLGTFALTGNSSQIFLARKVIIGLGAYIITGNSQDISFGRAPANIDLGTFALTGNSSDLIRSQLITAELGTYVLSGLSPVISRGQALTADLGTFAVTGLSLDINKLYLITAGLGTFLLGANFLTLSSTGTVGERYANLDVVDVVGNSIVIAESVANAVVITEEVI
jgi:hypothetical protein